MSPRAATVRWENPQTAIEKVADGSWGVAVSGGADSVALLRLLHARGLMKAGPAGPRGPRLTLQVVHVNHQARGNASDGDAQFVHDLASQLSLPFHLATRDQMERCCDELPTNLSARFRAMRFEFFRQVTDAAKLEGVILAHHAADQAETVLHRLLRGSSFAGLGGMSADARVSGVRVLRPLLGVRRDALRDYLRGIGQSWREDASNASPRYARNRIRAALRGREELIASLCVLGEGSRSLRDWVNAVRLELPEQFPTRQLADQPGLLASAAARMWLRGRGVPADELTSSVLDRLVLMSRDAATAPVQQFPGNVVVRRRGGLLFVDQEHRH